MKTKFFILFVLYSVFYHSQTPEQYNESLRREASKRYTEAAGKSAISAPPVNVNFKMNEKAIDNFVNRNKISRQEQEERDAYSREAEKRRIEAENYNKKTEEFRKQRIEKEREAALKGSKMNITLPNGNTFEGYVYGQSPDYKLVYGIYRHKEGDVYEGGFDFYNNRTGEGIYRYANGDVFYGHFADGTFNGNGKFIYNNGTVEEGYFFNGVKNGFGKVVSKDGKIAYVGNFFNGKIMGSGNYKYADGKVYEGDFFNGKYYGFGKLIFPDGKIEEGFWENGVLVAKDIPAYTGSLNYKGQTKDGKPHGKGKLTNGGYTYIGDFVNGEPEGKIIEILRNYEMISYIYIGDYKNYAKHGYGIYEERTGYKYEGEYRKGSQHGKGKETDYKGRVREGKWLNNEYRG